MRLNDRDVKIRDTRVANAFPDLIKFSENFNLDSLSEIDHKHVPYIVLLIKSLKIFEEKFGKNPSLLSKQDKDQFKEILFCFRKYTDEDNFDEAMNFFYDVTSDYLEDQFNDNLKEIFEILMENNLKDLIQNNNDIVGCFFIICTALKT